MDRVLCIGGPGNISTSTIGELIRKNYQVGIFTLPESPTQDLEGRVTFYKGNRNDVIELGAALSDFKPDIVIDFVCFTPDQAGQTANLIDGQVGQYIFVSTVDVYGYPLSNLPMRENDVWQPPLSKYAADKRACEEVYRSRFDAGAPSLTVVRPSYSFGKNFVISFFSRDGGRYLIPRLRAGRPILVPGDGTTLIHASSAYNTGRMIAQLVGHPAAMGQSFTCAHHSVMTHDDYVVLFASVVGQEPYLVHIPTDLIYSLGAEALEDVLLKEVTGFNLFYAVDKFRAEFPDFEWELSLAEAARQYVEWNDQHRLFPDVTEEIYEDKIIKAWQECLKHFSI